MRRFSGIWTLPQVFFITASCMGVAIPNSSLQCYCDCGTVAGLPCSVSDCGLSEFCVILKFQIKIMILSIIKIIICTLYGFLMVFGQSLKCTPGRTKKNLGIVNSLLTLFIYAAVTWLCDHSFD